MNVWVPAHGSLYMKLRKPQEVEEEVMVDPFDLPAPPSRKKEFLDISPPPTRRKGKLLPPIPTASDLKLGMAVRVRAAERTLHGVELSFPASKAGIITDMGETWVRVQWGRGAWENIVSQCHAISNLEVVV